MALCSVTSRDRGLHRKLPRKELSGLVSVIEHEVIEAIASLLILGMAFSNLQEDR